MFEIFAMCMILCALFFAGHKIGKREAIKESQNQLKSCQEWREHNTKKRHVHVID